ncbi:MAG: putative mycofactocin radical SAM maturase MftC [Candidatus Anoxychlamydiales bacterium]|nr:putative mycofactocin radical SAM maturase MftC [Candidatus Anoxychlamydiales bacterium]
MNATKVNFHSISDEDFFHLPIDIMTTYRCNLRCKKCYAPKKGYEPSTEEILTTLDKLYHSGIRRVVLTGGEPTVRKDLVRIAEHAKNKGFNVYLSTNGILLKNIWNEISPYLSWVSISLDGPVEINKLVIGNDGERHYKKVFEFLEFYNKVEDQNVRIKLGTVVTQKNKDYLIKLGNEVFKNPTGYRPDVWRLYQFSNFEEHNDNQIYIDEFSIIENEMRESMGQIKQAFPMVNISYATAQERDEAYIFVKPDQTLAYSSQGDYISIGNIKNLSIKQLEDSLYGISHIWGKCISNRKIYK